MDEVLASLGVQVESEQEARHQIIREKTISQLCLDANPLVTPILSTSAHPKLSAESILHLANDLQKELDEAANEEQRMIASLKNRFFKLIMTGRSGNINSEEVSAASTVMSKLRTKTSGAIELSEDDMPEVSMSITNAGGGLQSGKRTLKSEPFVVRAQLGERQLLHIDDSEIEKLRREAYERRQKNTAVSEELVEGQMLDEFDVQDMDDADGMLEGAPTGNIVNEMDYFHRDNDEPLVLDECEIRDPFRLGLVVDYDELPPAATTTKSATRQVILASELPLKGEPDSSDLQQTYQSRHTEPVTRAGTKSMARAQDRNGRGPVVGASTNDRSSSSSAVASASDDALSSRIAPRELSPSRISVPALGQTLQCPLCSEILQPRRGTDADAYLAAHMGSCTGRPKRRNHAATLAAVRSAVHATETGYYLDPSADTRMAAANGNGQSERPKRGPNAGHRAIDKTQPLYDEDEAEFELDSDRLQRVSTARSSTGPLRTHSHAPRDWEALETRSRIDDLSQAQLHGDVGDLDVAPEQVFVEENALASRADGVADMCLEQVARKAIVDDWEDHLYLQRLAASAIENPSDEPTSETSYGAKIPTAVWNVMHEYQKSGCAWLWGLHRQGIGGILGDEMGLGKTIQLCVHFNSLASKLRENSSGRDAGIFLIVCPATVLFHWLRELHRWVPSLRVLILHAMSNTGHEILGLGAEALDLAMRRLRKDARTRGLVALITYEGLRRYKKSMTLVEWTAVCLDEGQKIRNPNAEITKICKTLPAFHRIILSGTPIQNNLIELWSLIDFCYPGRLGTQIAFETEFATPIRNGGYAGAGQVKAEIAVRIATTLQRIVKPILLRRRKDDASLGTALPQKTEQVLFCRLASRQREIYRDILNSPEIESVLRKKTTAFRAITTLRKLCNHPALVYKHGQILWHDETKSEMRERIQREQKRQIQKSQLKAASRGRNVSTTLLQDRNALADSLSDDDEGEGAAHDDDDNDVELTEGLTWQDSGKLLVLSKVLPLWLSEGHKVLLFTQTQGMLNLIEIMMREFRFRYLRLDGSTQVSRREAIIEAFNTNPDIFVMILTTRTGGVGISLTAANRVVLVDPDWNPQTDVQARERAWRLGQKRDVTIFRLITRGTIEEKIYQRQIFKILLSNRILDNPQQKAFFSKSDIRDLFELTDETGGKERMPEGSAVTLASIRKPVAQAEREEGEEHEDMTVATAAQRGIADAHVGFASLEVEAYVEEELPEHLRESANDNDAAERDKRLLKVLYDGQAISSVHDHSFLEPGARRTTLSTWERESARQGHDAAVRNLTNSTRAYNVTPGAGVALTGTTHSNSSDATVNTLEHESRGRFGSKFGQFTIANSSAASSSVILAGLRERGSSNASLPPPSVTPIPVTAVPSTAALSIEENLEKRLLALFARAQNGRAQLQTQFSGSSSQQGPDGQTGLSSEYLLTQFRDIGDQYAPIFRETLRKIAILRNGVWYKKQV